MSKAYIDVTVGNGIFKSEKVASFYCDNKKYTMLVDSDIVKNNKLPVIVVHCDSISALIELPAETIMYGKRIRVPIYIIEFDESKDPKTILH